ncbi:hypothetical protein [Calycomorphotria hydatis]|uniref:Uncharacterized protein n=1 Tax=Calycomorphotria hydatis TaxID=2528027 RepID=A0A517TA81_9PLAN|nr:hypothetical protein [Calycomorphotria hydatis]QDT65276.1 hypothetical protein V22_25230 [Calycomorphotria hydatis]
MQDVSEQPTLSLKATDKLRALTATCYQQGFAIQIWERYFSTNDRYQFDNDPEIAYQELGLIGMWNYVRPQDTPTYKNLDPRLAYVLEVAQSMGLISGSDADWLLMEVGGELDPATGKTLPKYIAEKSELWFDSECVRKVRRTEPASSIERIILAFEKNRWQTSVKEPFALGPDKKPLHDSVRSLNRNLKAIKFRVDGGGKYILWEPVETT